MHSAVDKHFLLPTTAYAAAKGRQLFAQEDVTPIGQQAGAYAQTIRHSRLFGRQSSKNNVC